MVFGQFIQVRSAIHVYFDPVSSKREYWSHRVTIGNLILFKARGMSKI